MLTLLEDTHHATHTTTLTEDMQIVTATDPEKDSLHETQRAPHPGLSPLSMPGAPRYTNMTHFFNQQIPDISRWFRGFPNT